MKDDQEEKAFRKLVKKVAEGLIELGQNLPGQAEEFERFVGGLKEKAESYLKSRKQGTRSPAFSDKKAWLTRVYVNPPDPQLQMACEVVLDEKKIRLTYQEGEVPVTYSGENTGTGHFELTCPEKNGRASLHWSEKDQVLEGYWAESGQEGFWRIKPRTAEANAG